MIVMSASGLVMSGLVNREGFLVTAAYGAAQQIWTYLQMPAMAMGAAVSAMAAQNIGAGRWDRIGRITGYGMGYLLLITGMMVAVILLFHAPLLALFLGRNEAAIAAAWHIPLLASRRFGLFVGPVILFGVLGAHGVGEGR